MSGRSVFLACRRRRVRCRSCGPGRRHGFVSGRDRLRPGRAPRRRCCCGYPSTARTRASVLARTLRLNASGAPRDVDSRGSDSCWPGSGCARSDSFAGASSSGSSSRQFPSSGRDGPRSWRAGDLWGWGGAAVCPRGDCVEPVLTRPGCCPLQLDGRAPVFMSTRSGRAPTFRQVRVPSGTLSSDAPLSSGAVDLRSDPQVSGRRACRPCRPRPSSGSGPGTASAPARTLGRTPAGSCVPPPVRSACPRATRCTT